MHHVRTVSGYYFSVGSYGRSYGRFGHKTDAWTLCESCKDNLVSTLDKVTPCYTEPSNKDDCDMCQFKGS